MSDSIATIKISPPKMGYATFHIRGTTPLMTAKFSSRIKNNLISERQEGKPARSKRTHVAVDYDASGREAMYTAPEGWHGVHAAAFRNAAISACRLVNFKMTLAKLSIFVDADGYDQEEGTPLVRISSGEPAIRIMPVRNATGVMDLRARPVWSPGWESIVRIHWDKDQFTLIDITNLLARAGVQVGIGEGRPDSRESAGLGYGLFDIVEVAELQ